MMRCMAIRMMMRSMRTRKRMRMRMMMRTRRRMRTRKEFSKWIRWQGFASPGVRRVLG